MMLKHLGEFEAAAAIEHALLVTLAEGKLTGDVVGYEKGMKTSEYVRAIVANLGRLIADLEAVVPALAGVR